MNEDFVNPEPVMKVSETMKADLRTAATWAKFLCILGAIGLVLMVLAAIFMLVLGNSLPSNIPGMGVTRTFAVIIYLVLAALYIYPVVKGFQFANCTRNACITNNERELANGFAGLRSVLKFWGIMSIIVMVIYAIIIVGLIVIGITAASHL